MFDEQVNILASALSVYKQQTGADVSVQWQVQPLRKINENQYQVTIVMEVSTDRMTISPVSIQRVDGVWLVDVESFATASLIAFNGGRL